MKTLKKLSKIFIGELIAVALLLPFVTIVNGDLGMNVMDFIEKYILDFENMFMIVQYGAFVIFATYTMYSLYKAIESDVMDVKAYLAKKKETTN